jgi:hypothetical protein
MYEGIEKMGPVSIPLLIILRSFVFRVSEFRGRVLVVLRVRVSVESPRSGEDVSLMPMRASLVLANLEIEAPYSKP